MARTITSSASCPALAQSSWPSSSTLCSGTQSLWPSKRRVNQRFPSIEGCGSRSTASLPVHAPHHDTALEMREHLLSFEKCYSNRVGLQACTKAELCAMIQWDKPKLYPGELTWDAVGQKWLPAPSRKGGCVSFVGKKLASSEPSLLCSSTQCVSGVSCTLTLRCRGKSSSPVIAAVNTENTLQEWWLVLNRRRLQVCAYLLW
jgi:hypothetical protein